MFFKKKNRNWNYCFLSEIDNVHAVKCKTISIIGVILSNSVRSGIEISYFLNNMQVKILISNNARCCPMHPCGPVNLG